MNLTNTNRHSLRDNLIFGLIAMAVIALSLYLGVMTNSADKREMILSLIFVFIPILALYVLLSERMWIPILICLALIRDLALGDFMGGGTIKIGDVFIFIIFAVWVFKNVLLNRQTSFLKSYLDVAIVLFMVVHAISLLWSSDLDFGILRILKLVRNFCFFLIIRDLFINDFRGSYRRLTYSFILTSAVLLIVHMWVIISLGGIADFQALFQKEVLMSQDMGVLRARGTGAGILISGSSAWLTVTGIFIFGELMLTQSRNWRLLKTFLIVLMFSAAMLTLSRTAIITVGIILAVLLIGSVKFKLRENKKTILVILVIFAVVGSYSGLTRIFSKRLDNMFGDRSWWEREDLYITAIDAFFDSPIFGIGVGSNYSWQLKYDFGNNVSRIVHSLYLLILSETGMLGFVAFVAMVSFWLRYLWFCMRDFNIEPYIRSICLAMFAFSISFFVYSATVGEFENFEPWLVMGIASAVKVLYLTPKNFYGECYAKS